MDDRKLNKRFELKLVPHVIRLRVLLLFIALLASLSSSVSAQVVPIPTDLAVGDQYRG